MNCETCEKKDFVHSDLYCQGCKPKPRTRNGVAYLFMKGGDKALSSVEIEAQSGLEEITAMIEFMDKRIKIEFIPDEP